MNKKLAVVSGILITIVIAGFVYLLAVGNHKEAPPSKQPATPQEVKPAETESPNQPQNTPGSYQEYSEGAVEQSHGTKILFFHAAWCPQCRALEADIKAGPIPDNVVIFKVNYDNSQALRQKYNVTLQTSLVKIDAEGNLVKKYVAYNDPTLDALVKNLLP